MVLQDAEVEILQVGVIVKDLNRTVEFLSQLGLGPFDCFMGSHSAAKVKGERSAYTVATAGSQQGAVQLELIEYQSGKTIQKEFLDEKGEGIHHILFKVNNLDASIERFAQKGVEVLQEDRFVGGGGMAYMGTDKIGGIVFELVQLPDNYDPSQGLTYKN